MAVNQALNERSPFICVPTICSNNVYKHRHETDDKLGYRDNKMYRSGRTLCSLGLGENNLCNEGPDSRSLLKKSSIIL